MIINRVRRRVAAAVLSLGAVLATTAAVPAAAPAEAPAKARTKAAAPACPQFDDPVKAAADRQVDVPRITPAPVWRKTCGTLWRSDNRAPEVIFDEGFYPKDVVDGQYDIEKYVLQNQPSPYVSTTYDHDLYKRWKSNYNYYVDAPGGIDVNRTIGATHKYADQVEVAFPGGIARQYVLGACPVDKATKTEVLSGCVSNLNYVPWH
ncbi:ADP-ribosyltransferase [Streptomyces sp. NPDC057690]|uniref:ADP-ribosyltransferase n=1 Tax=Streptomyces sp. NPDC057690 TaxID=3346214 RepID=UPI0036CCA956